MAAVRRLGFVLLACAGVLAGAPAASAIEVDPSNGSTRVLAGTTRVAITATDEAGGTVRLESMAAIEAVTGCDTVSARVLRCPARRIVVQLSSGGDDFVDTRASGQPAVVEACGSCGQGSSLLLGSGADRVDFAYGTVLPALVDG